MDTKQSSTTKWPVELLIVSSIPILLMIIGIILAVVSELTARNGVYDVTAEHFVFMAGLYAAIPCGLIAIIAANAARSKGLVNKGVAVGGILLGVLSLLFGLVAWVWFSMISAFVF
jgi:hypothetical protein